jgi:hypothetical protein
MGFKMLEPSMISEDDWTKSTFSAASNCCVEVKQHGDEVFVRDSKYRRSVGNDPSAEPVIAFSLPQWEAFLHDVMNSEEAGASAYPVTRRSGGSVDITAADTQITLTFTADEWSAFVRGVQLGEFDVPVLAAASR